MLFIVNVVNRLSGGNMLLGFLCSSVYYLSRSSLSTIVISSLEKGVRKDTFQWEVMTSEKVVLV